MHIVLHILQNKFTSNLLKVYFIHSLHWKCTSNCIFMRIKGNLEYYRGSGRPRSNEFTMWNLHKRASEHFPRLSSFFFWAPYE